MYNGDIPQTMKQKRASAAGGEAQINPKETTAQSMKAIRDRQADKMKNALSKSGPSIGLKGTGRAAAGALGAVAGTFALPLVANYLIGNSLEQAISPTGAPLTSGKAGEFMDYMMKNYPRAETTIERLLGKIPGRSQ